MLFPSRFLCARMSHCPLYHTNQQSFKRSHKTRHHWVASTWKVYYTLRIITMLFCSGHALLLILRSVAWVAKKKVQWLQDIALPVGFFFLLEFLYYGFLFCFACHFFVRNIFQIQIFHFLLLLGVWMTRVTKCCLTTGDVPRKEAGQFC